MKIAFVDTAILTDVLINFGPQRDMALRALGSFEDTRLPVYAIKEFKAGALGALTWLHNKLETTGSVAETIVQAQRLMSHRRNLPATALQALAREMRKPGTKGNDPAGGGVRGKKHRGYKQRVVQARN